MGVGGVQNLTQRQKEILRLLLNGFDAKSAGRELGISVHTVNEHLREARRHLGVSSSREAARILRQVECAPPNDVGPNELGVVDRTSNRLRLAATSPNFRLAFAGVSLVMLVAAAVIAVLIANGGSASNRAKIRPNVPAAHSGARAQTAPYQDRAVPIGTFDRLKVSGPFKVGILVNDESAQVRLVGPPALLADTIATVEADTLVIRFREGATWSWNPGSGVNAFVSTPSLHAVSVEGAAVVEVYGGRNDTFSATTQGSGTINVRGLDVRHVQLATGGSGGISVEGRARDGTYVVGGAGSIDAKRLRVENASIAVGAAGSAYADVREAANISVTGSGRVEVVGGATCIMLPAHSPQAECR